MQPNNLPQPLFNVNLISRRNAHYYSIDGLSEGEWPGVTTVLNIISKPALIPWAANEAAKKIEAYLRIHAINRMLIGDEISKLVDEGKKQHEVIKDAAADLGTRAHAAINAIIEGESVNVTNDIRPCVDAFAEFCKDSSIQIVHGDRKIASPLFKYGGSLDALGIKNGKYIIVDFKTSNQINREYAYQVAAYSVAFKETYGIDYVPEAIILRLGKVRPDFEVAKIENVERSFKTFMMAYDLWRNHKEEHFESPVEKFKKPKTVIREL